MDQNTVKKRKYIFMYPDIARPTIEEISKGRVPRERLAGLYQLKEQGWDVDISDSRWEGKLSPMRRRFKRYFTIPSVRMFKDWWPADVIVIKDDFSLFLTLSARILRKEIVYLDSMFALPKSKIRRFLLKINLIFSNKIICFSETQANLWAREFDVARSKFLVSHYCVDVEFYMNNRSTKNIRKDQIIAIGRDIGRDFYTLISAVNEKDIPLIIVTLPYLLSKIDVVPKNVSIKERLSYDELFEIYSQSSISVVSLKDFMTYPSGIRAVMEAMLQGVPVIATRTPVLEEYFSHGEDILFVEAGSAKDLSDKIDLLIENNKFSIMLSKNATKKIESDFSLENYVLDLSNYLAKK
ncbi:hypothetical protein LCGC14_1296480 [marine sediment metagenome]|uniref:Glycosyltransferase n=2 Tax=root TaxID=1 RepID=A0A831R204_9GAMM|nr:glycosyltransferase family 4 protein [Marinobacter antarcticus]HDZ14015.1 glycosyltransferase [Pricia sp.]HEA52668.1 glycosyltransferase [Marinobacter antarcticus]